jgi:hypothetical protein
MRNPLNFGIKLSMNAFHMQIGVIDWLPITKPYKQNILNSQAKNDTYIDSYQFQNKIRIDLKNNY